MSGNGRGGAVRRRPRAEDSNQVALYFTYGSNLHIGQMADRCPQSKFIGKGTLLGFRWQINSRGVANIVETGSNHDKVRGLVFEVTRADVRILDRYEGVRSGAYSRETLDVYVTPNDILARKPSVDLAARLETYYQGAPRRGGLAGNDTIDRVKLPTLVYISFEHNQDGTIRDEYIARMANAMADAKVLGVDSKYIREVMAPPCQPPSEQPGASQPPPTVSEAPARPPGRTPAAPATPATPQTEGSHHAGGVGGVLRRLGLTRPREQRRPAERPPAVVERPPNGGGLNAPGRLVQRRSRANLVTVEPSARRVPAEQARTRIERERRGEEVALPERPRRRQQDGDGESGRENDGPSDTATPKRTATKATATATATADGGDRNGATATANGSGVAPKRAAAKNGNGTGTGATTNGESATTTPTANPSATATTKRTVTKNEGGGPAKATTNGEGSTTTPANASGGPTKRATTKTDNGATPRATTSNESATATATTNGAATAPKKKAATTKSTDDATTTATTATATTATATTATANTATNGTATATTKTKASTKNEAGTGEKPAATGAAATTKTKATKAETTAAQS